MHAWTLGLTLIRYTLVFDDKGQAGIRVNWQFDEYFSAMISGDYDTDKNGVINQDENQKIKEEAYYYDMIYPWELIFSFRLKSQS